MTIQLRPAISTDDRHLARLWVRIFPDKFTPILGDHAEAVIRDWFRLSQRHLHLTTLAEIDGQLAGFIILHHFNTPASHDEWWFWQALRQQMNFYRAVRIFVMIWLLDSDHCTSRRELYIEMIGVDPAWRRQGVAQHLISHAKMVAQEQRMPWLTLSVLRDNYPARQLYANLGFKLVRQQRNRLLEWGLGHPGYDHLALQIVDPAIDDLA